MKKLMAMALVASMTVTLVACGGKTVPAQTPARMHRRGQLRGVRTLQKRPLLRQQMQ